MSDIFGNVSVDLLPQIIRFEQLLLIVINLFLKNYLKLYADSFFNLNKQCIQRLSENLSPFTF